MAGTLLSEPCPHPLHLPFKNCLLAYLSLCVCMCMSVRVCVHACLCLHMRDVLKGMGYYANVEVGGQLCVVGSLLLPLCAF